MSLQKNMIQARINALVSTIEMIDNEKKTTEYKQGYDNGTIDRLKSEINFLKELKNKIK